MGRGNIKKPLLKRNRSWIEIPIILLYAKFGVHNIPVVFKIVPLLTYIQNWYLVFSLFIYLLSLKVEYIFSKYQKYKH